MSNSEHPNKLNFFSCLKLSVPTRSFNGVQEFSTERIRYSNIESMSHDGDSIIIQMNSSERLEFGCDEKSAKLIIERYDNWCDTVGKTDLIDVINFSQIEKEVNKTLENISTSVETKYDSIFSGIATTLASAADGLNKSVSGIEKLNKVFSELTGGD